MSSDYGQSTSLVQSPAAAQATHLIEEDVLAIAALGGKVLEVAILAYPMFLTQELPELTTD